MPNAIPPGTVHLHPGDALLLVHVQNDFLPGGSLAVPDGDQVIAVLNDCIGMFVRDGYPVFATRDWHPVNHCSFRHRGGPWPVHCVADTPGAAFAADLNLPATARVISQATDPAREAYSGFDGTDLDAALRLRHVRRLIVGGLATDYCVLHTVRDALRLGYAVVVLADAVRAVDARPSDGARALDEMKRLGAQVAGLEAVAA